jgi:hypothetical protein
MNGLNQRLLKNLWLISAVIAWSTIAAYAQGQPAQKVNASANVISGRITTGDNQPLTNARVSVGRASGIMISAGNVRVDSEGRFSTQPLEPGLYFVGVYVPGLIREPGAAPATSPYLRPGDTVDFKMIKGGVITGSVKNANGDGLIAIPVHAFRVRNQNGDPSPPIPLRDTLTDDRGIYRLYGVAPGSYIVSAGGQGRGGFGLVYPSAYEAYVPTYAPSATRDTAMEIQVSNGNESQADIQFREERGHVISGTITGAPPTSDGQQWAAGVVVYDSRNRADVTVTSTFSNNSFSFAAYGVSDGEYEVSASLNSRTNDSLESPPVRIKVQGADVTGIRLVAAPLASLDGRVIFENDPKNACGKHRDSALVETIVNGRRFEPRTPTKEALPADVRFASRNTTRWATVDARGIFSIKNVPPGTYQIEPNAPASGWYVRSVALDKNVAANIPRDGLPLRNGDHATGLTVTFAEGAAKVTGHLSAAEGQPLPLKLRVYLVPEEKVSAGNLYRYYETAADKDGKFILDNVAPGRYLIVARRPEESEPGLIKLMRLDETLRTTVLKEAEASKKLVAFKPCEQVADFDLSYVSR